MRKPNANQDIYAALAQSVRSAQRQRGGANAPTVEAVVVSQKRPTPPGSEQQ